MHANSDWTCYFISPVKYKWTKKKYISPTGLEGRPCSRGHDESHARLCCVAGGWGGTAECGDGLTGERVRRSRTQITSLTLRSSVQCRTGLTAWSTVMSITVQKMLYQEFIVRQGLLKIIMIFFGACSTLLLCSAVGPDRDETQWQVRSGRTYDRSAGYWPQCRAPHSALIDSWSRRCKTGKIKSRVRIETSGTIKTSNEFLSKTISNAFFYD